MVADNGETEQTLKQGFWALVRATGRSLIDLIRFDSIRFVSFRFVRSVLLDLHNNSFYLRLPTVVIVFVRLSAHNQTKPNATKPKQRRSLRE